MSSPLASPPAPRRAPSRARTLPRALALALGAAALVAYAPETRAQQAGWALDRFDPAPAGDRFLSAQHPRFAHPGPAALYVSAVTAYAYRPLTASVRTDGAAGSLVAVEHALATHVLVNVHLLQRLGLDLGLPVYWAQRGSRDTALPAREVDGVALGDLRLGARVRLAGHAHSGPASLHLGATGYLGFLGLGSPAQQTSDGRVRARFYAAGAGSAGPLRWALTAGVHLRPGYSAPFVYVGNELYANAALGVSALRDALTVGLEALFAMPLERAGQPNTTALELLASARLHLLDDALALGLGAGPGFTSAPGTPTLRAVFSLTYAPRFSAPGPAPASASANTPRGPDAPATNAANPAGAPAANPAGAAAPDAAPEAPAPRAFCEGAEGSCSTDDADGDGVRAPLDECPTEPAGDLPSAQRAGCPASDGDHDRVADDDDACPEQAAGPVPDPERRGCPLPDRDGDRIADAVDHCPDAAGAPHPDPNLNGCPGLVQLDEGTLRILQPIFFAPNRDTIERRSTAVLEGVRQALLARSDLRLVVVEGHTDDRGNDELNVDLSHRRAASVVRWLTDRGIDPSRLRPIGFGPSRPRTPLRPGMNRAQSNAARADNRRVQFELVTP